MSLLMRAGCPTMAEPVLVDESTVSKPESVHEVKSKAGSRIVVSIHRLLQHK